MQAITKRALFGGALMTAGLAHAQPEFDLIDAPGDVEVYAYAYDRDSYAYGYGFASIGTVAYSYGAARAIASLSLTEASVNTFLGGSNPFSAANGIVLVDFTVSSAIDGRLTWDITTDADDSLSLAQFTLSNFTTGQIEFAFLEGSTASGSIDLPLTPGNAYQMELNVNTLGNGSTVDLRFEAVPSPASATLLGLAGLAAARRRR